VHDNSMMLIQRMKEEAEDVWTLYGSVYLPHYTTKVKRDRTDF
jgi:hypothetical protein